MKLRQYQSAAIRAIFKELKHHDKALVVLATGAGKTVLFSELINIALAKKPHLRILILVNRNILINQTDNYFEDAGVFCAGLGSKDLNKNITIASIQSLVNWKKDLNFDFCVIDECHTTKLDSGIGAVLYQKLKPIKILGVTATPFYANGVPLWGSEEFFTRAPCFQKTIKDLTLAGYLAPIILAGQGKETTIDTRKVKKTKDDFVLLDLERVILNNEDKIKLQVKDIIERTKNRNKVAIMCVSIAHAEIVQSLLGNHISVCLHSKQNKTTQQKARHEFINGDKKFIVSVAILTTGWDFPKLDAIAICRPTRSRILFVQIVGRATRKCEGKKDALILDYGNIVENLGHPYDIKPEHNKRKRINIKMCTHCLEFSPSTKTVCKCGQVFMTMCGYCQKMKPYGERCDCGMVQARDYLKNLEISAERKLTAYSVHRTEIYLYKSRSGKYWPRIDYYNKCVGFERLVCSEFVFHVSLERLKKTFVQPLQIWVGKEKGYNKIFKRRFK